MGSALSRRCSIVSISLLPLDAIFEHRVDVIFHRTGEAAKFLLFNHVVLLRNTHSLRGGAFFKSEFFLSLAVSSFFYEKECQLKAARPVHGSTLLQVGPSSLVNNG